MKVRAILPAAVMVGASFIGTGVHAGGLPATATGALPGPAELYAPPLTAPELSNDPAGHFLAPSLLVSGADAYQGGEYMYQDYVYDDHGARELPGEQSPQHAPGTQTSAFSPYAGTIVYPTAAKYANNAADLLEFRVTSDPANVYYRLTLNTMVDPTAFAADIAVDRAPGASHFGLTGLPNADPFSTITFGPDFHPDSLIQVTGAGAAVRTQCNLGGCLGLAAGAIVAVDSVRHQVTVTVPRAAMDPGTSTWRYLVATGLSGGTQYDTWLQPGVQADATHPGGCPQANTCPGIFNLAFRFNEPVGPFGDASSPGKVGIGNWREDAQADGLAHGTISQFHEDVDFSRLGSAHASDPLSALHLPTRGFIDRLMSSRLSLGQGVQATFPEYLGDVQPYALYVPLAYDPARPAGFTYALHSLSAAYNQFAVYSPNQYRQLGDQRYNFIATPLSRGQDGWYFDSAEYDTFEVWNDVAQHYALDSTRSYVSGYSMGGWGTYKLGLEYPDLFASAFSVVGPPANSIWLPPAPPTPGGEAQNSIHILNNAYNLPYLIEQGTSDELVPPAGVVMQADQFKADGLRYRFDLYPGYDHFAFAQFDDWSVGRDFLGTGQVNLNPEVVDYTVAPALWGAVLPSVADHAYWVSGITPVSGLSASAAPTARVHFDSAARGRASHTLVTPAPAPGVVNSPSETAAYIDQQQTWDPGLDGPNANELDYCTTDVSAATVDMSRSGLDPAAPLTLSGSATATVTLNLSGGWSVPVQVCQGSACSTDTPSGGVLTVTLAPGSQSYTITP
ncbi:MAG: alpha/beta hydrolase-fold protein [Candidatus Dormibacteria bacterium]